MCYSMKLLSKKSRLTRVRFDIRLIYDMFKKWMSFSSCGYTNDRFTILSLDGEVRVDAGITGSSLYVSRDYACNESD